MVKFGYNGDSNPGDGSRLPLKKKLKKALYNLKVKLTSNKEDELESVRHVGRALK
jgi:hypothetical protein